MKKTILFVIAAGLLLFSCGEKTKEFVVNGVTFKMVKVEGGTFTMGCTAEQDDDCREEEIPAHSVTLSDYWICETEVTQGLWEAVMGTSIEQQAQKAADVYEYADEVDVYDFLAGIGSDYPMYNVSYHEVVNEFIPKLNRLTGCNFRLPTEAEWEYAARGGKKTKGFKYAGSNNIDDVAWYEDDNEFGDEDGNHPVKTKHPNELGLYDMSGNVWEWCNDWYGDYTSTSQTNPKGPSSGSCRVFRGGSWDFSTWSCRVSCHTGDIPSIHDIAVGFRLAFSAE